jgi:hypothetical protein
MRLVEQNKVLGLVLVAAYDDDLGDELERNSGYFSRPWDWHKIRSNAGFIGAGPSTHPSKRSASTRAVWCHLREPVFDVGTDVVTVGEMVSFHHFAPLPQHQCGSVSTAFKPWIPSSLRLYLTLTPPGACLAAQFAGTQDSLVPIDLQRRVASALESEFFEDPHGDHFFSPPFPQLISVIDANVAKALSAGR